MTNAVLKRAKIVKNDEFYTLYKDVKSECDVYSSQFKGKTIYCNCDSPIKSMFVRYFVRFFNHIGLKRLIATGYGGGYLDVTHVPATINVMDFIRSHTSRLNGNGDFRSPECIVLLNHADIIVTNPPFSLFGQWYSLVKEYRKRFLVLTGMNNTVTRDCADDMVYGKIRFGSSNVNKSFTFRTPNGGRESLGNCCWLTNLNVPLKPFIPFSRIPASKFDKVDGSNILYIPAVNQIPDTNQLMAVPITFLFKHNPRQFKIVGMLNSANRPTTLILNPRLKDKLIFKRIVIQKR